MHREADDRAAPGADDGIMSSTRSLRTAAAIPCAAVLLITALAGCSAVGDALQREASHQFATRDALVDGWEKKASWLPADAESIVTRESTMGAPATLTAVSTSDLDPDQCAEVERRSAPTIVMANTPDVYKIDRVLACGDWAVVETEDGWYGWTPNHPDEKAASPAS